MERLFVDLPETTAFKSYAAKHERKSQYANYPDILAVSFLRFTHSEAPEGYPAIVNNIQPCQKRCLLMPLARVGARTDSTTLLQLQPKGWPFSAHAHWYCTQDNAVCAEGFALHYFSFVYNCSIVCFQHFIKYLIYTAFS